MSKPTRAHIRVALDLTRSDTYTRLTPIAVKVLLLIWHYQLTKLGYAAPSIPRLARRAGCSERSVRYAIRDLEDHGVITVDRRYRPLRIRIAPEYDGAAPLKRQNIAGY